MLQVENLESRNAPSISFSNGVLTINTDHGLQTINAYRGDSTNPAYYDNTYFEQHDGLHTSYGGQLLSRLVVNRDQINSIIFYSHGQHDYLVNHTGFKITINTGTSVFVVGQGIFDVEAGSVERI